MVDPFFISPVLYASILAYVLKDNVLLRFAKCNTPRGYAVVDPGV